MSTPRRKGRATVREEEEEDEGEEDRCVRCAVQSSSAAAEGQRQRAHA